MTTSADILNPPSTADLAAATLAKIPGSDAWDDDSVEMALVQVDAETRAAYLAGRRDVFNGGYIDSAKGPYLDLAATFYGEKRAPAKEALLRVTLSDTTGKGPYPLQPNQILSYKGDTAILYYRIGASVTVPKSGSVQAYALATIPGADWNLPAGVTLLGSSLPPGVAVSTPPDPATGGIVVSTGADAEGDDSFRARCKLKLSQQGKGWAAPTIESLLRERWPQDITAVLVRDPDWENQANAYVRGPLGPVDPLIVKAAYEYLKQRSMKPSGSMPVGVYAVPLQAVGILVTLFTKTVVSVAEATKALVAFQGTLGIGDGVSEIYYSQITDALDAVAGVFASEVRDAVTGELLESFAPAFKTAVVFQPSFKVVSV